MQSENNEDCYCQFILLLIQCAQTHRDTASDLLYYQRDV